MVLIKQQVGVNITNIDSTPMILSPGMKGKGKTLHVTPGSAWEAIPLQWLGMRGNFHTMPLHGRQFLYNLLQCNLDGGGGGGGGGGGVIRFKGTYPNCFLNWFKAQRSWQHEASC